MFNLSASYEIFTRKLTYNLFSNATLEFIPVDPLSVLFVIFAIVVLAIVGLVIIVYLSGKEALIPDSNIKLVQTVQDNDRESRGNIDIRYAMIPNGVQMRDHANSQTNTPNRASVLFYDSSDNSGNSIENMPFSSTASRSVVTVMVNGVATKGFCIYGARLGNNQSRLLKINESWLVESQRHNTVTTLGYSLVGDTYGYQILSSNPVVTSFNPTRIGSILN